MKTITLLIYLLLRNGFRFILLDEHGNETTQGEVALIPPAIGLSTELLNADHEKIYYSDMPTTKNGEILRRHGDQIQKLNNNLYCILGRVDDTMNLSGIKVSSAEIERVLTHNPMSLKRPLLPYRLKNKDPIS